MDYRLSAFGMEKGALLGFNTFRGILGGVRKGYHNFWINRQARLLQNAFGLDATAARTAAMGTGGKLKAHVNAWKDLGDRGFADGNAFKWSNLKHNRRVARLERSGLTRVSNGRGGYDFMNRDGLLARDANGLDIVERNRASREAIDAGRRGHGGSRRTGASSTASEPGTTPQTAPAASAAGAVPNAPSPGSFAAWAAKHPVGAVGLGAAGMFAGSRMFQLAPPYMGPQQPAMAQPQMPYPQPSYQGYGGYGPIGY